MLLVPNYYLITRYPNDAAKIDLFYRLIFWQFIVTITIVVLDQVIGGS